MGDQILDVCQNWVELNGGALTTATYHLGGIGRVLEEGLWVRKQKEARWIAVVKDEDGEYL